MSMFHGRDFKPPCTTPCVCSFATTSPGSIATCRIASIFSEASTFSLLHTRRGTSSEAEKAKLAEEARVNALFQLFGDNSETQARDTWGWLNGYYAEDGECSRGKPKYKKLDESGCCYKHSDRHVSICWNWGGGAGGGYAGFLRSRLISGQVGACIASQDLGKRRGGKIDFGNTGCTWQSFTARRQLSDDFKCLTRTATCIGQAIPSAGPGAHCRMAYTWPAGSSEPAGAPLLVDCVDGDGASLPFPMQDLSGNQYLVDNWCVPHAATEPNGSPASRPSFKQLAAEQYPDALAHAGEWEVVLRPGDDSPAPTLNLTLDQVTAMVIRGEIDPWANPVFLLWTDQP